MELMTPSRFVASGTEANMNIQKGAEKAGYKAYHEGTPKHRNPFQYTSDIFKQAAWLTGWNKAERDAKREK